MKNRLLIIVFGLVFLASSGLKQGQAQEKLTTKQAVEYINLKLDPVIVVQHKRGELVIEFYKNGEVYREDRIFVEDIDLKTLHYAADEKALIMKCGKEHDDECVDRKLIKNKIRRYYSRLNIPMEKDAATIEGIRTAFEHIIRMNQERGYSRTKPFGP